MVTVAPISNFETNAGSFRGGRNSGAKVGRPLQAGERYPSGKLKPLEKREGGPAPAEIKRTFDRAIRDGREPLLGTSLGLLMMRGEITPSQLAAGTAYARLQGRYDRAMGMPCRFTASPDYGTARAMSDKGPMSDDDVAAIKARHGRMLGFIGGGSARSIAVADGAGGLKRLYGEAARPVLAYEARRTIALLERVCVDDLACEGYEIGRLQAALDMLMPWFGLGSGK
ncbi:MAG: hypothetical protein ACRYGP_16880 [Janthinobacterium lividum]